jgi:hypothetical protein
MKQIKFLAAAVVLALLAGAGLAQAQEKVTADIGFKFMAGSVAMAPGKYNIERVANGAISVRDAAGKVSAILPTITTLGRHDTHTQTELVFDVVGATTSLSEVWFGGLDGVLVLATKEGHKHQVVDVK